MKVERIYIRDIYGDRQHAVAPVIISASRTTDIPAFFSDWLLGAYRRSYVKKVNSYSRRESFVSFSKARAVVYWTKNPEPMISKLAAFEKYIPNYYFLFTLNNYEQESYEPGLPSMKKRIETFQKLSNIIGKEKVQWRFDPLILTDKINTQILLDRFYELAGNIGKYTEKVIFSFADIMHYSKVRNSYKRLGIRARNFTEDERDYICKNIFKISNEFNIKPEICGEPRNYELFGIDKARCIDDRLLRRLFSADNELMAFLGKEKDLQTELFGTVQNKEENQLRDPGQRENCNCILSRDIGMYNTCRHFCVYCYANISCAAVEDNLKNYSVESEGLSLK